MSDDFDKQDDDFDWLGDDNDDDSSSSQSGLTGQLSWLQDSDGSPDAGKGKSETGDLDLDWLQDDANSSGTPSGDSTGVTGELSWLSDETVSRVPDSQSNDEMLDWLDDNSESEASPDDNIEQPIEETPEPTSESPDWLSDVGDTGMLSRDSINEELDNMRDDLDSAPSWLSDVGDTGMLNRDAISQELDDIESSSADEQPDWLSGMGIGDQSSSDQPEPVEDTPDWLSGMAFDSDEETSQPEEFDLENMFGVDDEDDGDLDFPSSQSVASTDSSSDEEHDTGWLDYEDDGDDDYDPYAQYEDSYDDSDEEYEDLFSTGTSGDTDLIESNKSLFDSDQPRSDVSADDTPDWLADFDEEDFGEQDIPEPVSADEPDADTDWLDEFDEDSFTNDPLDDVPDWLQTDDSVTGDTEDLAAPADTDDFASAPEMTADELLESMGLDVGDRASTGLTGELDNITDDLEFESTGLTGELESLDDDDFGLLDDIDLGDLELDDLGSTGLTGELPDLDDIDMSFIDDVDVGDDAGRVGTGLTGELSNLDDDMDLSFLDEVDTSDEVERVGTGLTGELGATDDDMDLSFLDEVDTSDDVERVGTGLTGELSNLDDEMDLSFLDEVEVSDSAPDRAGTGLTGDLDQVDEELDLDFLDDIDEEPANDWFGEASEDVDAEPDWMQTLSDADLIEMEQEATSTDLDDIFDSLDLENMDFGEIEDQSNPSADLDTLLAGYEDFDESDFDSLSSESGIEDLDAIFDAALSDENRIEEDELPTEIPEWLQGVDISSDEKSAAAIIRQQDDKPIEELDDRLQALHEKGLSIGTDTPSSEGSTSGILDGVGETLVAPTIAHEAAGIVSELTLTDNQKKQSALLQQIVGVTITPSVETDEDGAPIVESTRRRRSLPAIGLGRLLVSVILLMVLILPFVSNFGVGTLPPSAFGADNQSASVVFQEIESLNDGDWVLVGFEYGPTGAGELDPVADILLRHIVSQGAKPIIVSSNPIAIVHAQNIVNEINQSVASSGLSLVANRDYYITRFLTGGTIGLRDLSQNLNSVVNVSAQGEITNISLTSLDELALMVLIAEKSEDIRAWSEQVVPSTTTHLVAATGFSAQPLAEPYVDQTEGIQGLMVGYRDAYTYGEMLQALYATATPSPTPTETPSPTATNTPLPTNTSEPTATTESEATEAPDEDVTPLSGVSGTGDDTENQSVEPTDEPTATNTPEPTDTPEPTATSTDTPEPTATSTNTPSPTPTPRLITVIVVTANNASVNVRTGPSQNFPVITTASSGDVYQVIGENEEGDWINFLLPDGRDGWIAAFLVEQTELPEADFEAESEDSADAGGDVTVMRMSFDRRLGKNQVRYYQQNPTATPEAEVTPEVSSIDPRASFAFDRDRQQETSRLNAMTLGTIAAVVIILFGNIYFGLQAFMRRRRESKR